MAGDDGRERSPRTQHELPQWRPPLAFWRNLAARPAPGTREALVAEEERLRGTSGNTLRAAVLGANDGVLTNLNLVMGVVGAHMAGRGVVITGLAGLLAGALSMALGEWVSVRSSQELNERALEIEGAQILAFPEDEFEELVRIYQAKGLNHGEARYLASRLMEDHSTALDTMAREEWGIDPCDMGGNPWNAAVSSFVAFGVGALVPVVPFMVWSGTTAVAVSLAVGTLALFFAGVGATYVTARNPWVAGLRQVLFGLVASAVTYGLGLLLDTRLAP